MAPDDTTDTHKHNRKLKEREPPQPTDLAEKMIALQRKNHAPRRDRPLPPQPSSSRAPPVPDKPPARISPALSSSPRKHQPAPHLIVSRPSEGADPDEFSRRLKISNSPRQVHSSSKHPQQQQQQGNKLFNPETDPIPMRHTAEPESISDTTSSSYVHVSRGAPSSSSPVRREGGPSRQLFDHRKDDPVRFSVLARPSSIGPTPNGRPSPTPKSSGEYVSASSTSSYAHSITSSNFTLSSNTTDGSSASSALFDRPQNEEAGNNAFAVQLKRLYRGISALETKILNEEADDGAPEESRVVLKGRETSEVSDEDPERQKWKKLITDHKRLAEMMHNLLEISLAPSVPASLRNIPTKYNIIIRLWTHAFHRLLESLRRSSFASPLALEHLQDFIYYAYTFYTGLLEEQTLRTFRAGWLEALGDLARYRMAVAAMVTGSVGASVALTTAAVSKAAAAAVPVSTEADQPPQPPKAASAKSSSDRPAARIDDSPSPSVGLAAARLLDVEPEKERWRGIARDWYAAGLADTPGTGKLHHHLGLLSREVEGEELRAVYHFVKSMTTLHPFPTSRESVLPIWSPAAQARRTLPDARMSDLFVLLHGMLFTNIQLDDFPSTLARFLERLQIEGAEEREWIMMAVVNVGAVLEYGRPGGVLKKYGGVGARDGGAGGPGAVGPGMRLAKRGPPVEESEEKRMDVDDGDDVMKSPPPAAATMQTSPAVSEAAATDTDHPASLKFAMQLTFAMLSHVLRDPSRKPSPFARSTVNPYLTVLLTFLATVLKHAATLAVLERAVPWDALAAFFASGGVPRSVLSSQEGGGWVMLTSGCAPPLPEDWCLRGMEWVGRKVFERGYWKSGEDKRAEVEVLDMSEGGVMDDGIIEEDDEDEGVAAGVHMNETSKRWMRIVRCGVNIAGAVDGFSRKGTREWKVEGALEEKMKQWREEDRLERETEERRRRGTRWADDAMDVDEEDDPLADSSEDESREDDDDTDEVKALKARRRYLRSLLLSAQRGLVPPSPPSRRPRPRGPRKDVAAHPALCIVPGYTVLVVDTNILLSSLSTFASIIESLRWTVVVPLPVIMELDGLSANTSQLGEAAKGAMEYITSHIRSHATSLKVQTSKGNYLVTLSVRSEQVDFDDGASWDRNMDDLILKAAIWQDEHWVNRSAMLKDDDAEQDTTSAVKVVLLSLDRNLRLKARSRQLPAASEKDLASILATGT